MFHGGWQAHIKSETYTLLVQQLSWSNLTCTLHSPRSELQITNIYFLSLIPLTFAMAQRSIAIHVCEAEGFLLSVLCPYVPEYKKFPPKESSRCWKSLLASWSQGSCLCPCSWSGSVLVTKVISLLHMQFFCSKTVSDSQSVVMPVTISMTSKFSSQYFCLVCFDSSWHTTGCLCWARCSCRTSGRIKDLHWKPASITSSEEISQKLKKSIALYCSTFVTVYLNIKECRWNELHVTDDIYQPYDTTINKLTGYTEHRNERGQGIHLKKTSTGSPHWILHQENELRHGPWGASCPPWSLVDLCVW